jgi:prophage antirepressor-like protein
MIYSQKINRPIEKSPESTFNVKAKETFTNDLFGELTVIVHEDEKLFFVAKEVAESLGYSNTRDAIIKHCKGGRDLRLPSSGGIQLTKIIPESDLYRLVMKSTLPSAEKFQDWVMEDVLPSIRKIGMYATDNVVDKFLADPDFAIKLLTEYKEEKQKRLEAEQLQREAEIKYNQAEERLDILIHNDKTYTVTQIAKECGFRSAIMFNRFLAENKIQFRKNNMWLAYAKYVELGYFDQKQQIVPNKKNPIYYSKITQVGREFLLNFTKQKGS